MVGVLSYVILHNSQSQIKESSFFFYVQNQLYLTNPWVTIIRNIQKVKDGKEFLVCNNGFKN